MVMGGWIEGSNVNPTEALVRMISLSRSFDAQMQLLSSAQTNDAKASTILMINS
jgi:flagellar basal-body rod protein FlgF